jgi:hypothetical protein
MKAPRRNRVITFRLTEREYQGLKSTCDASDSYISKGARQAILGLIGSGLPDDPVAGRLVQIDGKFERLLELAQRDTSQPSEADDIPDADKNVGGTDGA